MVHFTGDENKCPRAVDVNNALQNIVNWGGGVNNRLDSQGVLFAYLDDPMLLDMSRDTYTFTLDEKYTPFLNRLMAGTGHLPILVILHDNESLITTPATIYQDTNGHLHLVYIVSSGIRHAIYQGSLCIVTTLKI